MINRKMKVLASSLLTIGMAASNTAWSAVLEEVIVTSQKRAQSVNDIGIAATAFTGDDLRNLKADSPMDLAAHTPGLSTTNATSGGTPIFAIRGVGLDDFNINNNSGVGVYVDEIFASSPMLLSGQLFDIERVEVLKGPQGTLYGRNATGGAINFISQKPSDETSGSVILGVGKWNTKEIEAVVNGALTDSINGRLGATYTRQSDGWQTDVDTGKEYGEIDRFATRGLLDFELSDSVSALLNVHYSRDKSLPSAPQSIGSEQGLEGLSFDLGGEDCDPTQLDYFCLPVEGLVDTSSDGNPDADDVRIGTLAVDRDEEGVGGSLNITADFDPFTLISITAYDEYERKVIDNYDGVPGGNFDYFQDGTIEQFSQEFRLVSNSTGNFSWVAGLSYADETLDGDETYDLSQTLWFNVYPDDIYATGLVLADSVYTQKTKSFGVYGHTETEFTDQLKLTVGLRYTKDERSFEGNAVNSGIDNGLVPSQIASLDDTNKEDNVTYRIGLDYQPNENWMVYGSVATGVKSGVYYGSPPLAQESWGYVDPEEVLTVELGFKATLLDGSMQLNGAIFQSEYKDRQSLVLAIIPDIGFDTTLVNVPESEIKGAELDLTWAPVDGMDIRAGISYLDAYVTETIDNVRGLPLFTPIPEGATLSQAPEYSYNLLVGYEWNLSDNIYTRIQADYSYVDEQIAALSDPNSVYGSIESLGARLALASADSTWEVALWGSNLTDEDATTYSFTNFAEGGVFYRQQPRNYGVTLSYYFN